MSAPLSLADDTLPRPNVIVIISDDAGYNDFGSYGSREIPTPHFDRLMTDGVRFTQGYVCASVCHPSRAGILTGRYPQRFGQEFNGPKEPTPGHSRDQMGLDVNEKTIARYFQEDGYRTIEIGKWHMGSQPQFNPLKRGFDECFLIESGNRSYFPYKQKVKPSKRIFRNEDLVPEEEISYVTDSLTEAAIEFIGRSSEQPFFMYLAYTAVHTPMQAKSDDVQSFHSIRNGKRRTYAAMMKALDDGIGRIREAIATSSLAENTLIVFVNDNGGPPGNASDNSPLRGVKGTHFEGGNRVAYSITWPGELQAGTVFDNPVSSLDILPTTLAAANIEYESEKQLDGVNLLPYLTGDLSTKPHETLYWRRGPGAAVRHGDWKLLRVDTLPTMLFNLSESASEDINLIEQHPDKAAELEGKLEAWEAELAKPKWDEGPVWAKRQIEKHKQAMNDIESVELAN